MYMEFKLLLLRPVSRMSGSLDKIVCMYICLLISIFVCIFCVILFNLWLCAHKFTIKVRVYL